MAANVSDVIEKQRAFARSRKAHAIEFRKSQLRALKSLLQENEQMLFQAIQRDFGKSEFETYATELGLVYHEINLALKRMDEWSRPRFVSVGLMNFPGQGIILPEPFGSTLVIGAWNYPYQLTLAPVVGALAAGNVCLVKPSELAANTSSALAELINRNFDPGYLHVVEGGVEVNQQLLSHAFDKIFFTGSTTVGRIVAKAAAEYLTPVTLELGGKSPCLVFKDADLAKAAQRIVWGKFLNAGQTCIAPDYLIVEDSIYEKFLGMLRAQIEKTLGQNLIGSEHYVRIINRRHFDRLRNLIDPARVFHGGKTFENELSIEPTLLRDIEFSDPIMREEIFGPLLPVLRMKNIENTFSSIADKPKPLSLYVFTEDVRLQEKTLSELSFGGGCINDVVMHIASSDLPFGGVGESGMGRYHGEEGFKTFSHFKSVLKKPNWIELPLKYAPYTNWKKRLIHWLMD